jgi:hypothetical protein
VVSGEYENFLDERAIAMVRTSLFSFLTFSLAGLMVVPAGPAAAQEGVFEFEADEVQLPAVRLVAQPDGEALFRLAHNFLVDNEAPQSEYWLGIGLEPLPDVAKQQLGIEHGLVVADVAEDGPAAKAEIKRHDILIKAGDAPIKIPADLIKAVDEAKEKGLRLIVLRGGKDVTIEVVPAKRPEEKLKTEVLRSVQARPELRDEIKRLEEALESLKGKAGADGFSLVLPRAAAIAPHRIEVLRSSEFPKNLSVQIHKEGDKPAKIRVKRDDKEWEITEDKIEDLPEDLRPHVHRFFGRLWAPGGAGAVGRSYVPGPKLAPGKATAQLRVAPVPERALNAKLDPFAVEEKLGEIIKEIKELRKDVDDLRGRSPAGAEKR